MKLNKKSFILLLVVLLITVFGAQSIFASVYQIDSDQTTFTKEEAYYINGPLFSADVLQFMQAFQSPDSPLMFFSNAAQYTDQEIEQNFYYYLAFLIPQAAGQIQFNVLADLDEFAKATGTELSDDGLSFQASFTSTADLAAIYPGGLVLTEAYDGFRTTARNLLNYTAENGKAPPFDNCTAIIEQIYQQMTAEYEEAMQAETADDTAPATDE